MRVILLIFIFVFISCESMLDDFINSNPGKSWKMVWNEEFDGQQVDSTSWSRISRGSSDWNNYMSKVDTCYEMRNGKLILKGFKNTFLSNDTAPYITGGVYTKDKVTFTYGKVSVRAKLNAAKGAWPAIWMLPQGKPWPDGGEIDIMERLNYDNFVYQTIHSYYTVKLGIKNNPKSFGTNHIDPNKFNTYSVEIYKDKLIFSVNGRHTFTYKKIHTDKKGQFPFGSPYYLLIDMQLGGNWVGEINDEDLPVEMEIDWVRFYEKK